MLPLSALNPKGSSDLRQELSSTAEKKAINNNFIFMMFSFIW
jgi:hypothetical protein